MRHEHLMGATVAERLGHPAEGEHANLDVAWLRAAAAGEREAVERLVAEVGPVVYGFLYARVGGRDDVAADLLQETMVEAVRSAPGFRGDAALATWMCAIARRRVARYFEAERRQEVARRGLALVVDNAGPADPLDREELADQRDEVVRALGTLTPLHRQVLVLKYLDGRSVEEIATEMRRSRTSIQSLLQRARVALRESLEGVDG